ncbi:MAG: sulfite exporter TauE/SafE family protein [Candidatus Micrarchaeota archaeon]
MLIPLELVLLFITALAVGIIGNIAGIGGGVLIMAIFLFLFRINPVLAGGFSLVTIITSAAIGSLSNLRQNAISRNLFYSIVLFAGIGAVLGSALTYFVEAKPFEVIFSVISIGIGIFSVIATRIDIRSNKDMMLEKSFSMLNRNEQKELKNIRVNRFESAFVYLIAGLVAGFMGIGIGGIAGTYLTAIRKANPKIAFSSVLAAMIVTSVLGSIVHFAGVPFEGTYLPIIGSLVLGAALGAVLGSYLSARIKSKRLRQMQGYIIISLGFISLVLTVLTS